MDQMLSRFEVLVSPSTEKKTEGTTQFFCLILRNFLHESNTGSTKEQVFQHGACTGCLARNSVSSWSSRVSHLGYGEIILHSLEIQVYKAHMQMCFLSLFASMDRQEADISYTAYRIQCLWECCIVKDYLTTKDT